MITDVTKQIQDQFRSFEMQLELEHLQTKQQNDEVNVHLKEEEVVLNKLDETTRELLLPLPRISDLHLGNIDRVLDELKRDLPSDEYTIITPVAFTFRPDELPEFSCGNLGEVKSSQKESVGNLRDSYVDVSVPGSVPQATPRHRSKSRPQNPPPGIPDTKPKYETVVYNSSQEQVTETRYAFACADNTTPPVLPRQPRSSIIDDIPPQRPLPNIPDTRTGKAQIAWKMSQGQTTSLDFLQKGDIIAVVSGKVRHFGSDGQPKTIPFSIDGVTKPWTVSVHRPTQTVALTQRSTSHFHMFYPGSERWRSVVHTVEGKPYAVSMIAGGYVMLETGDSTCSTLSRYSARGLLTWKKELAHPSLYLSTDNDGRFVVSSSYGGRVYVYNKDGNKEQEFPTKQDESRIRDPCGVCNDSQNNIYIADYEREVISMFSPRGRYVRDVVKVNRPWDVAVFDDRIMAVGTANGIVMFQFK